MNAPQPKPTTYRDQDFRSRLEARWAVFLDWNPLVDSWNYEPEGFRLDGPDWTYLPDFLVKVGPFMFYLEVKPEVPDPKYLEILGAFAIALPYPLSVAYGSFFKDVPKVINLTQVIQDGAEGDKIAEAFQVNEECLGMSALFPDCEEPLNKAMGYRFDLIRPTGDEVPPFRGGNPGEVEGHIKTWVAQERVKSMKASRKKRKNKTLKPRKVE